MVKGGADKAEKEVEVTVNVKAKETVTKVDVDELTPDEKTVPKDATVILDPKGSEVIIKFAKKNVESASVEPKDKGVSAEGKDDWVKITIAKEAKPGEFTLIVKPTDKKAKELKWTFKTKAKEGLPRPTQ